MVVEPVVYGASEHPPRGNYRRAGADYTCAQDYATYTEQDHDTYRRLYARQEALLPGLACDEFIAALPSLGAKDRIPRFEEVNERLRQAHRVGNCHRAWAHPRSAVLFTLGPAQISGDRLDSHTRRV